MAEIESVVNSILENLRDDFVKEVLHRYGVSELVEFQTRGLSYIQLIARNIDGKRIVDERKKQWVEEIKYLAYWIENVLETFLLGIPQKKDGNIEAFKWCFTKNKELKTILRFISETFKIWERIEKIDESRPSYGITDLDEGIEVEIRQSFQESMLPDIVDAENIVSSVEEKLRDSFLPELLPRYGVHEKVELATRILRRTRALLKEVNKKRLVSERQKQLAKDVRDLAYCIQDVLDTFLSVVHQNTPGKMKASKGWLTEFRIISAVREFVFKINQIMERFREIDENIVITYGITNLGGNVGREIRQPVDQQIALPYVDDADIVGFEADKKKILSLLLEENISWGRYVISIVGTGGLGKTTLALNLYNSEAVKKQFDIRMWVTISRKFEWIDILKKIAEQLQIQPLEGLSEDQLMNNLRQSLRERKSLLVLDDIWTSDFWDLIKVILPCGYNGSRILITTRFLDIAMKIDPISVPYKLQFLTEEPSLQLLLKKALCNRDANEGHPDHLYNIGKQFLKKCGGLPLALVALGDLLSENFGDYYAWSRMVETMDWGTHGEKCIAIIGTSYEDLHTALQSCFMYFAAFFDDYDIDARSLLRMWIAEGFIPREEHAMLEDTAERFLEDLVQRSMIEVSKRAFDGSIERCRVHTLMRALAIQKAKDENFLMTCSKIDDLKNCIPLRRLAINDSLLCTRTREDEELYGKEIASASASASESSNMRSLLSFRLVPNVSQLVHLKVLRNAECTLSVYEPEKFGRLRQLRYVELILEEIKRKDIHKFHEFIGGMKFLQTLDLRGGSICDLPDCVWLVETLRHVLLPTWPGFTAGPPPSLNLLINLQTLSGVTNRKSWVTNGTPRLPNVKLLEIGARDRFEWNTIFALLRTLEREGRLTTLQIIGDDIPLNIIDVRKFSFYHCLKNLDLWNEYDENETDHNKIALEVGMFPNQLTTLSLKYLQFQQDPMPVLEKLENLKLLFLGGSKFQQVCCSAGGFGQLEELEFWKLEELEEWKIEEGAMPMLKKLQVSHCPSLRVPLGLQSLNSLQGLTWYSRSQFHKISKTMANEIHNICKHVPSIITAPVW